MLLINTCFDQSGYHRVQMEPHGCQDAGVNRQHQ